MWACRRRAHGAAMETKINEIADGIYRLSTWVEEVAPPVGFTFNQFFVDAEEPLLFHAGLRRMFPLLAEAVARIRPVEDLRWISFGHVEADECGGMNDWLAAAPRSQVIAGALACDVSLNDLADRPPVAFAGDGDVIDLGGKRVCHIATPHVPHGWDAQVLYEETTGTLLCGDLFTHVGDGPALVTTDIVEPAIEAELMFHEMTLAPNTVPTLTRLAEFEPTVLALMHGSSFAGDGGAALRTLAAQIDERFLARV
jgi:flavorubredoxin